MLSAHRIKNKDKPPPQLLIQEKKRVRRQIGRLSSISSMESRDPVTDLQEHFKLMCHNIGMDTIGVPDDTAHIKPSRLIDGTSSVGSAKKEEGAVGMAGGSYAEFSNILFGKGKLSAAILHGTGKSILISCLKRTAGQPALGNARQHSLSPGSTSIYINNAPGKLLFHQHIHGAVGLILDTCRNLSLQLELFEKLAEGTLENRNQIQNIDTLYRLYPFLNTNEEVDLLEYYKGMLKDCKPDTAKNTAVTSGINKLNGIMNTKRAMRMRFMVELRQLIEKVKEMEALFSDNQFTHEIYRIMETGDTEEPGEVQADDREQPICAE